jgi:hypothetical protein
LTAGNDSKNFSTLEQPENFRGIGRLSSLEYPRNPNQNYGADEGYNDGANHPTTSANPQQPKQPSTNNTPEKTQDNVNHNAIAPALHELASQPTGD